MHLIKEKKVFQPNKKIDHWIFFVIFFSFTGWPGVPMSVEAPLCEYKTSRVTVNGHSQPVLKKLVSINIAIAVFSAVCLLRETNLDHV